MNSTTAKKQRNLLYWSVTIFILLMTIIAVGRALSTEDVPDAVSPAARVPEPEIAPSPVADSRLPETTTLASPAVVSSVSSVAYPESAPPAVNPETVKEMVQELSFDDDGNLVVTPNARRQLDHAINLIGYSRNSAELAQLNEAIHGALPGEAGKQVTDLLGLYYEYKLVEIDFAHSRDAASPADAANHYQILSRMRQSYLGDTLAKKLFAEEDQFMKYTHELMQLDDPDNREPLSDEQRSAAEQQLKMKYFPTQGE